MSRIEFAGHGPASGMSPAQPGAGAATSGASAAPEVWTIKGVLDWTRDFLQRHGDEHPRRSAEWLLCAATGLSRVELYTNFDRPLEDHERDVMREGVRRRAKGEPLQYVTGEMPFRHIVLKCAPGVLIPRPETEILVDEVLQYIDALPKGPDGSEPAAQVLEVGTGTGCIALSIAGERPDAQVVATDIAPEAVALAKRNRDALGLTDRVRVVGCDLASGVPEASQHAFDVLVSNPPYIPTPVMATLPREVGGYEPTLALDGGKDGLDVFRRLVELGTRALKPGGLLACELFEDSLVVASELPGVRASYENVRIVRDLTGRNRHLLATLKAPSGTERGKVKAPSGTEKSESGDVPPEVRAENRPQAQPEGQPKAQPQAQPSSPRNYLQLDWDRPQPAAVGRVADVLSLGGVAVLPTDTVYGIAQSVAANPLGARRLYEIKRRDPGKAIAWLIGGTDALLDYGADVPAYAMRLAHAFWPGGLTLVVKAAPCVPAVFRGPNDTIALRVPAAPIVRAVARELGCALVATSANISGEPAPASYAQLDPRVRDAADIVLDDGLTHSPTPSTVVVCTGPAPLVTRVGIIPTADVVRVAAPGGAS